MSLVALALALILFCWSLRALRLVPVSLQAFSTARQAAAAIKARDLSEHEKEAQVQAAALRLFTLFGSITLRAALALGLPALAILVLVLAGMVTLPEVIATSTSWPVLAGTTLAASLALWPWPRRLRP